jgi:hypothetical protein
MAKIETFTRAMVEDFLRGENMNFMIDQDGDIYLPLGKDDDTGVTYKVYLMARPGDDIYSIVFLGDRDIPKNTWGKVIMACNEWNTNRRWPTASLHMDQETGSGQVFLEGHIKLGTGVHQEFLKRFTLSHVAGGISFWEWVTEEKKF